MLLTVALAPLCWWKRITASGQDAVVDGGTGIGRPILTQLLLAAAQLTASGPHSAVFGGEIEATNTSAVAVGGSKLRQWLLLMLLSAVVDNDAPIVKRWLLAAGNIPVANTLRVRR
jgi:hypothetical protein